MNAAARAKVWVAVLITGAISVILGLWPNIVGEAGALIVPLAFLVFCGLLLMLCFVPTEATHPLPDLLGWRVESYFDQNGFSFAPVLAVKDETAVLQIFFQN
jgi:hypothetical protein